MKIVIVAAKRTAIGTFMGTLKDLSAVDLGVAVAKSLIADLPQADIADVIIGNVLQAGAGMNPARQIVINSGRPTSISAQTINRVCASGMQAVVSAVQAINSGDGRLYLAGGIENMSRFHFSCKKEKRAGVWEIWNFSTACYATALSMYSENTTWGLLPKSWQRAGVSRALIKTHMRLKAIAARQSQSQPGISEKRLCRLKCRCAKVQ
jgi:acetyl-CoA acetyltransferase